ncbi:hypothetical protein IT570_12205 [Candidatus Sumerlaeota bacterium]|nr:hypothetical protein [Candidatus Sumerlaeota bacterium]
MTKATKRRWMLVALVLGAALCSYVVPQIVALNEARPRTAIGFRETRRDTPALSWLLVVGRRAERTRESDPTPHRNSRIALYERKGETFRKASRDFAIRSTTSNERLPEPTELATNGELNHGFISVPFGFYSLHKGPWRYPGEIGFEISDWNRTDGVIALKVPQVIERVNAAVGETTFTTTVVRSSYDKTGSWLHMSRTKTWSYRDSDGCMSLYKPVGMNGIESDAPAGPYDWDEFLKVLKERNLVETPPHFYVATWAEVGDKDQLKDQLDIKVLNLPEAILAVMK